MLLQNEWANEDIGKYLKTHENRNKMSPNWWDAAEIVNDGGFYNDTGLYQEVRKISRKQPNLPSKWIRKRTKP